jgi:hypothetical protein
MALPSTSGADGSENKPNRAEPRGSFGADEELALSDPIDRLPWLESDDDDRGGHDTGQMFAFAIVGLMAVVLLVGAIWWLTRDRADPTMVADGSTIEAPDEPYKVRPADPGGRQVAGTGDTSFAVAEGRTVEGRLAEPAMPSPSVDRTQAAAPSPNPSPSATASPTVQGIGVQVGAYSTRAAAETGWTQLSGRIEPLQGRSHRVVEGTADSGTIYRLQAVAGSVAEADALCRSIKASGGDCQVKR